MSDAGELGAIASIARWAGPTPPGQVWIGDDAACVPSPQGILLMAVDAVVAGVHCDLDLVGLDDMGWKAVASNVSDIAAMGGTSLHILCSVAGPPETDLDLLYQGIVAASREYGVGIAGGDLTNSDRLSVSVSITGHIATGQPVLRSTAQPGDTIMSTGPLGKSAAGLATLRLDDTGVPDVCDCGTRPNLGQIDADFKQRNDCAHLGQEPLHDRGIKEALIAAHRRPVARWREGIVARRAGATAMIDVSDGLGIDIDRLAKASKVGVSLDFVPVAAGATLDQALGGGEDYELIFTSPSPKRVMVAFAENGLRSPIVLGTVTSRTGDRLLGGRPFAITGFQHSWARNDVPRLT